jgi:hypothetical protein
MYRRQLLLAIPLVLAMGCVRDNTVEVKSPANPDAPDPVVVSHLVEYRVTGTISSCTITSSDTQEGLTITTTALPWFQQFRITKDTFLFLEAASADLGVLHVQIFVDGVLFREAFFNGFEPRVSVNGTYHVS